jgi:hypothetical protein
MTEHEIAMSRNFGMLANRARIERAHTAGPEFTPDIAPGDVGHFVPPVEQRGGGQMTWPRQSGWTTPAIVTVLALAILIAALAEIILGPALGRDGGRYVDSNLKTWFDGLASGKGLCCSFADGVSIQDVDWDTKDGRYRVRIDGRWIDVPDAALVTEPNKFGLAVAWPYQDANGTTQIRCFMPGAGT